MKKILFIASMWLLVLYSATLIPNDNGIMNKVWFFSFIFSCFLTVLIPMSKILSKK